MSIPKLFRRVVCIADDPALAAVISSYFVQLGRYFCVFESPRMARPDVINEVVGITNTLAKLQPDVIIFAGLSPVACDALRTHLPIERIIHINMLADTQQLAEFILDRPILRSSASSLAEALVICAREEKNLEISETENCSESNSSNRSLLVVCERGDPIAEVIAANYAISIDADFCLIEGSGREEAENLQRSLAGLYDLDVAARDQVVESVKGRLRRVLNSIRLENRMSITFVTTGIPYGVVITSSPSTHLLSLLLGTALPRIIMAEYRTPNVRSTLLIDPGVFNESEAVNIFKMLSENQMHCKTLFKQSATALNVSNAINYFPYELLVISSHVGELTGQRWHFKFKARDQSMHVGVMDIAVCFAPLPGTENVKVTELKSLVSIDGVHRNTPQWEALPDSLIKDYVYSDPENKDIFKIEPTGKIQGATAIQLYDHAFMPMSYVIANFLSPIVFNNGCASWIYLAERFMFAGARTYIGTLSAINGLLAKPIAESFVKFCLTGMPLSESIWRSQGEVFRDSPIRLYAMIGCHFSTLKVNDNSQLNFLKGYLNWAATQWVRKANEPGPEDVCRNSKEAANISRQYLSELHNLGC